MKLKYELLDRARFLQECLCSEIQALGCGIIVSGGTVDNDGQCDTIFPAHMLEQREPLGFFGIPQVAWHTDIQDEGIGKRFGFQVGQRFATSRNPCQFDMARQQQLQIIGYLWIVIDNQNTHRHRLDSILLFLQQDAGQCVFLSGLRIESPHEFAQALS